MLSCISRVFICVALFISLFSCNTDKICNENRATYLRIGLYSIKVADNKVVVKDSSFAGYAFKAINGSDTLWVDSTQIKVLTLPLSPHADSSIISLKLNLKSANAFENYIIIYKRSPVFINYECGFRTDFVIDTLISSNTLIDSIYINSRVVTDLNENQIKIFIRPAVSDVIQP